MADKVTLANLVNLTNSTTATTTINNNSAAITAAIDNTLSRDGTSPNQMGATLDMNSNRIINLPNPISVSEPTTLGYMNSVLAGGNINSGLVTGIPVSGAMQPVLNAGTISAADVLLGISTAMQPVVGASTVPAGNALIGAPQSFATRTAATAATINTNVQAITTTGLVAANDGGGGVYVKVGSLQPSGFQSADGAFWNLIGSTASSSAGSSSVLMKFIGGAWVVYKPDGSVLSTVGTTTSGLQEAINYGQTNGYSLFVVGPGITQAGSGVGATITCTTALNLGPMDAWCMSVTGVIIDFPAGAVPNGNGALINVDTQSFCSYDFNCQIQSASATALHIVQFVHTTNSQPSNNPYIQNNYFHFRTIVAYGGAHTSLVCFIGNPRSIQNNYFKFEGLLSGGKATQGILVVSTGPLGTFPFCGFVQNIIDVDLVVGSTTAEIFINVPNSGGPTGANIWRIGGATPSNPGMTYGIGTGATFDIYDVGSISVNAGSVNCGFQFLAGSSSNQARLAQCFGTTTDVIDAGTYNTYFSGGNRTAIPINVLGGAVYTNVANFMARTKTSWTNNAGASSGTLTNAPAAGNPTKWIMVDDNGSNRSIPAW